MASRPRCSPHLFPAGLALVLSLPLGAACGGDHEPDPDEMRTVACSVEFTGAVNGIEPCGLSVITGGNVSLITRQEATLDFHALLRFESNKIRAGTFTLDDFDDISYVNVTSLEGVAFRADAMSELRSPDESAIFTIDEYDTSGGTEAIFGTLSATLVEEVEGAPLAAGPGRVQATFLLE